MNNVDNIVFMRNPQQWCDYLVKVRMSTGLETPRTEHKNPLHKSQSTGFDQFHETLGFNGSPLDVYWGGVLMGTAVNFVSGNLSLPYGTMHEVCGGIPGAACQLASTRSRGIRADVCRLLGQLFLFILHQSVDGEGSWMHGILFVLPDVLQLHRMCTNNPLLFAMHNVIHHFTNCCLQIVLLISGWSGWSSEQLTYVVSIWRVAFLVMDVQQWVAFFSAGANDL